MGYDNAHPIAEVINAAQDEIAYSSFEGIHKANGSTAAIRLTIAILTPAITITN